MILINLKHIKILLLFIEIDSFHFDICSVAVIKKFHTTACSYGRWLFLFPIIFLLQILLKFHIKLF